MPDLLHLRELGDQIVPPPLDDLRSLARARQRRTAGALAVAGSALTLVVVATLTVVLDADDRTLPPAPQPTSTPTSTPTPTLDSLTPRQVVDAPDATLLWAVTSWEDPNVRIAGWMTVCDRCEKPAGARSSPSFTGLALTTDGYQTTTYLANPVTEGVSVMVTSPTDDTFLLEDDGNGGEWLVATDGTVTPVQRVDTPIEPVDDRHWFECVPQRRPGPQLTWCALDVDTATAYAWPARWGGGLPSGARPDSGVEPWGIENGADGDGLDAWWQVGDDRRSRALTEGAGTAAGIVRNSPTDGPLWWTWEMGSDELVLLDGGDRTGEWSEIHRPAPQSDDWFFVIGTPSGALIAFTSWPTVQVWRADDLEADFEPVYAGTVTEERQQASGMDLVVADGRLMLSSLGEALTSDDDGRTWSVTTTWR
jgi:hypothetical protein